MVLVQVTFGLSSIERGRREVGPVKCIVSCCFFYYATATSYTWRTCGGGSKHLKQVTQDPFFFFIQVMGEREEKGDR